MIKTIIKHQKDVEEIQQQMVGSSFSLKNQGSNTMRDGEYKRAAKTLDFSKLSSIVEINEEEGWVKVEPKMTMRALTLATLKRGFVPLVVPEFTSITVGGAIMGAAIESSSHLYGQFSDTTLEYELLLGDGSLVIASPHERADLFYGLSGSYGSLALLTLVKLRIKKASKFVELSLQATDEPIDTLREAKGEFIEGIVFSQDKAAVISGNPVDKVPKGSLLLQQKPWFSRWYYHQILSLLKTGQKTFYLPIEDYLFRFDRSAFWMGRYLLAPALFFPTFLKYHLESIPERMKERSSHMSIKKELPFLLRLFVGGLFGSKTLYGLWHKVPFKIKETLFFIQDFYTPADKAKEALSLFSKETGVFPIWLCPVKGATSPQFLSPHFGKPDYINIGLYGIPQGNPVAITKNLENKIIEFGGRKMLYAITYYPENEFNKIYNTEQLALLREKYSGEKFLPLYNKVANVL